MKFIERKIEIPKFLHEVYGYRSSVVELVFTYITILSVTSILVIMADDLDLPLFQWIIYVLLIIDLTGGVVSNFTEGTNHYYAESAKRRLVFISLHVIQPLLMYWIFPDEGWNIALISFLTLSTMLLVNGIGTYTKQRFFAAVFITLNITVAFLLGITPPVLLWLLIMFIIKLVLAFAVRWR